jgi:hypothetical protein
MPVVFKTPKTEDPRDPAFPEQQRGVGESLAAGALIILYFLLLTYRGLGAYFTGDDVVNIAFLHGYGRTSLGVMLAHALAVFSTEYRPMAGLYYRTLFALFGPHMTPFRVVFFGVLIVNLIAAGTWFWRLSGSRITAACAALLFAYQPALAALYYDNGTIYDVLCVLFALALMNCYVRMREEGRFVTGNRLLLVLALNGAALGSKEMAVTLPAVLLLYEAIFHPHWRTRDLFPRLWPIFLLTSMTVLCMIIKILVPNQLSMNPGYAPHIQARFIAGSYLHYYQLLFLKFDLSAGVLLSVLLAAVAAAALLRSRLMWFGLLFANLTLMPVCVVLPRGGFVWYMPLLGWALYGGAAISVLTDWLAKIAPRYSSLRIRAAAFAALTVLSYAIHAGRARTLEAPSLPEQNEFRSLLGAVKAAAPHLPHGARILIESDPHPGVWWMPLFLIRLGYQDPAIWVDRAKQLGDNYDARDVSLYDVLIRWDGAQYRVTRQPQAAGPRVPIAIAPAGFAVMPGAVRRGQPARIQLPATFANCAIDVAYRMPDDELIRSGVWNRWSDLNGSASGTARVNVDAERGKVVIDRVRGCGQGWVPAEGSFVTEP